MFLKVKLETIPSPYDVAEVSFFFLSYPSLFNWPATQNRTVRFSHNITMSLKISMTHILDYTFKTFE